jgi:hypothetical protein
MGARHVPVISDIVRIHRRQVPFGDLAGAVQPTGFAIVGLAAFADCSPRPNIFSECAYTEESRAQRATRVTVQ